MGVHPEGLAKGAGMGFTIIWKNNKAINLILQLLLFSTNHSRTVKNGSRNDIHNWQWVPQNNK